MRKNLEYLYAVARQMMGSQGVWQFATNNPEILDASSFRRLFQADVERDLRAWGDDKLGMIAALGRGGGEAELDRKTNGYGACTRTTLTDVGIGEVMTQHMSGRVLLLKLASLTVVAAMLDLACSHHKDEQYKKSCDVPDRAMHF